MQSANDLKQLLFSINHKSYPAYKSTRGAYQFPRYTLSIDHVQGDPFAAPSRVSVHISGKTAAFPSFLYDTYEKRVALQDYLLRQFARTIAPYSFRAKGSGKSGLLGISRCGQEILERTACVLNPSDGSLVVNMEIGFPANGRTIASQELIRILFDFLPGCVEKSLFYRALDPKACANVAYLCEDQQAIRSALKEKGLTAFIADGSILPRETGVSDLPMKHAVPFTSPESLRVTLDLPNRGPVSGMGIPLGVTLIVGGGFHGKSTLLEAMMSKYEERDEEEPGMLYDGTEAYKIYANVLPEHIKLIETRKPEKHFFFRAGFFFNHAAELDRQAQLELRKYSKIYAYKAYGGRSLLEQSHGESFLSAFLNYASRNTLFILDEPEAALSPQRQLALLVRIHELVNNGCQLIISTHSPILMAYPNADIYAIDDTGAHITPYEETEHYQLTKYFLTHTEQMMKELLE